MLLEVRKIFSDLYLYVSIMIRWWKNVSFCDRLWQYIIIADVCIYNSCKYNRYIYVFKYFYTSIMNLSSYIIMMNLF